MTTNPYSAPAATVADPVSAAQGNFVPGGHGVGAGRGWGWIAEGWALYKKQPWMWIAVWVVMFLILIVLGLIPLLGPIANALLWPILSAGLMLGCHALVQGERLEFGHLFAGFRERLGTLAGVGAITFVLSFVVGLVVSFAMFSAVPASQDPRLAPALAGLVTLAILLPVFMAVWFAPVLVVFHERGVLEAMKESFTGCLRNIVPFLVYGVIGLVLAILASIPFALGWLILGPVLVASIYAGYRDIYFKP